jgi:ABC-type transport system involved in multi-copper enzyme maturation permease subunit
VLVVILGLCAWLLSAGNMHIQAGDSDVGGHKSWITSQFAMAQFIAVLTFLCYLFFIAVASGMVVIQDEESKIGEILHATPLSAAEYVWGKFGAITCAFLIVLVLQLGFHAFFNHVVVSAKSAERVGPFDAWNYIRPALIFALPTILFAAGTSFAAGERTRRPILVFFLPIALLLACGFFLWNWSPTWLDPRWNRLLMLVDPGGLRWLDETWLKGDRGVDFYNTQPIGLDAGFVASRVGFVLLGLVSVVFAQRHFAATLRGERSSKSERRERALVAREASAHAARADTSSLPTRREFTLGSSSMRAPGLLAGLIEVARVELIELKSQPGLYLFVPLILLQTIGTSLSRVGAFEAPVLATPGTLAASTMNTLTLLVCLLLLFYTVESLERERSRGLSSIYYATPIRTASILFGKTLANSLVGVAILIAAFLACAIVLLVQGKVGIDVKPFAIVWGALLLPTFVLWCSFVTCLYAVTRNRYGAYACALALLTLTGYLQLADKMNWAGNWDLWSTVRWSDIAPLELDRGALVVNRLAALSASVFFTALAVRFFPRRGADASSTIERVQPLSILRGALRLSPFAAVPVALVIGLWVMVRNGYEGEVDKKHGKDYWAKNIATWRDVPRPSMSDVVLDLELEPARRWFKANGVYTLTNDRDVAMREIALTPGLHFEHLEWTLDGEKYEPVNRAGLYVFTPKTPLAPGSSLKVGFQHDGVFPKGSSENGGRSMEAILPSGVVLTSFSPSFVPVVGYMAEIGIDKDNKMDAKEYPDDFYVGQTDSGFGNNTPCTTNITIHVPEAFRANSVGELVSDTVEDGRRTLVWKSDHPVSFFNVVAGKWAERRGEGTAIYYHPEHEYNIDEMMTALDGARRWYSEWFYPYPWKELKLSEFPAISSYAQGFPTNITFSESIGFLTESTPKAELAFMVTSHEAAHQWWGNILNPGKGPNGNILSEGAAHFSTILLMEQVKGLQQRIEFCKRIEERYNDRRVVDSERPLVKIDGSRDGDETVMYDKGGWVFWMLLNKVGRENMLKGCQAFIREFEKGPDHPVLQDFVATARTFAPDAAAYDAFVHQWFFEVVVPEYKLTDAKRERVADTVLDGTNASGGDGGAVAAGEQWEARVHVENIGKSTMPNEIAATRGERFPESADAKPKSNRKKGGSDEALNASVVSAAETERGAPDAKSGAKSDATDAAKDVYREARTTITLGPGESQDVIIRCDFEPALVLVDPDALVLQLRRKAAIARF